MELEFPEQRADILAGLEHLAAEPQVDAGGADPRWPDLRNAIHWVVDDTWWDHRGPEESIGRWLYDEQEADACRVVVALLVEISKRLGQGATDSSWFADPTWRAVRQGAAGAAALLSSRD